MARGRRRPRLPTGLTEIRIESLSHDGRGVGHVEGKTCFVQRALPGELVRFKTLAVHKNFDEGDLAEIIESSPERVEPRCQHFELCGGCSLQHIDSESQITYKQKALMDALEHIGKVKPAEILPPLVNDHPWGYRRKARLGVKDVKKKGRVLVGFRERASAYLAALERCEVLHPKVGLALTDLANLVESLSLREQIPQIEVAMDEEKCALIFRNLEAISDQDRQLLADFAKEHGFIIYLQPAGPDSIQPLAEAAHLAYELPDYGLKLSFLPTDFTQVNLDINRKMIAKALELLAPGPEDRVLDLFCGIGNFSLPLATRAGWVTGVEGDQALVDRAKANAQANQLENIEFFAGNLFDPQADAPWMKQQYTKVLLDPPRTGAMEILEYLPKMGARQILYISCYPATLARDAGILVNELGYKLLAAGVMDMFPHTAHVESIALFSKKK